MYPPSRPALRTALYGGSCSIVVLVLLGLFHAGSRSLVFRFTDADAFIPDSEWSYRAERVKQAFKHAFHGYERYAMPQDELRPISNKGMNGYNGWGVTVFDSLDTMLLMGLEDEYSRALQVIKKANFTVVQGPAHGGAIGTVPYFETIIRYLGGLLSAYALSNDTTLLRRAEELADILDPVFDSPSGLAAFSVNPITHGISNNGVAILAEFASFQIEYTYLAKVSGKKKYYDRVNTLKKILKRTNLNETGGMLPTRWDIATGLPNPVLNKVSVGAQADSTHEYLLKEYLLTGMSDKWNLEMYLRMTTYILTNLLYLSPTRGLLYVTDASVPTTKDFPGVPSHVFEHLSCFLPGLLALGAHLLPLNNLTSVGINLTSLVDHPLYNSTGQFYRVLKDYDLKQVHLWAAQGLAQTCWLTYADQPSGLGPDEVMMLSAPGSKKWNAQAGKWEQGPGEYHRWIGALGRWKESGTRGTIPGVSEKKRVVWTHEDRLAGRPTARDYHVRKAGYLLRPETVESFYFLWRTSGDIMWRKRGWAIFEAIEREAKTESGYVTLKDVGASPALRGDSMPSFFLAETLKYLYLLFRDDDPLPLDKWVFNTEAHAVPVFSWTPEERRLFNV